MKEKRRSTGLLSEESIRRLHGKATESTRFPARLENETQLHRLAETTDSDIPPFSGKEYLRGEVRTLWTEEKEATLSSSEADESGQKKSDPEDPRSETEETLSGEPLSKETLSKETLSKESGQKQSPPPEYDPLLTFTDGVNGLSLRKNGFLDYYQAAHLNGLDSRQILELILQFAVPFRNTAPLADELLSRFGSFYGVLGAGVDQLMTIKGMTREASVLLDMFIRVARLAVDEQNTGNDLLNTDERVAQYLINKFFGLTTETIMMLCLDNTCRLINCTALAQGSSCVSRISTRRVFEIALGCNAANVILAHNHPGGIAYPSQEDIRATELVSKLLKSLDVELLDHVILAGKEWCSMARMGCLAVRRVTTI